MLAGIWLRAEAKTRQDGAQGADSYLYRHKTRCRKYRPGRLITLNARFSYRPHFHEFRKWARALDGVLRTPYPQHWARGQRETRTGILKTARFMHAADTQSGSF